MNPFTLFAMHIMHVYRTTYRQHSKMYNVLLITLCVRNDLSVVSLLKC